MLQNYTTLFPKPYLAPFFQALDFSGRMKRGTVPFGPTAGAAAPAGLRGGLRGAEVALWAASDTCGLAGAAGLDVRRANFCVLAAA